MVFEVYTELVFKSPAANTPILEEHWLPASLPLEGGHILEADLHIAEADNLHQVEVHS